MLTIHNCERITIMNCDERNKLFLNKEIDRDDLWPKIKEYESRRFQFRWEFGLDKLPMSPGLITIRGARQIGKSTWLEFKLLDTLEDFGPGTAFILNGDTIYSHQEFEDKLLDLERAFLKKAKVKRIFIDEVTQIQNWERVIKRLIDSGHLKDVLIVTTGSNAADLRRGGEKLPGRKGNLIRNEYVFLPISFKEFYYQVKNEVGTFESDILFAYLLSGGSPLAVEGIYRNEKLEDSFINLISDWVLGDIVSTGRSRIFLLNLLQKIYTTGTSTISYTKLAKEAGLSNNTAALEYVERLADLLCIYPMMSWDNQKNISLARKASKIPFINLSVAWTFHPKAPRYIHELKQLKVQEKGALYEWAVAQELWRRQCLELQSPKEKTSGKNILLQPELRYWSSKDNEIDFVQADGAFVEVKAGACNPLEFSWFHKVFPKHQLKIISESEFETDNLKSLSLKKFLLESPSELYFDDDRSPWLFLKD